MLVIFSESLCKKAKGWRNKEEPSGKEGHRVKHHEHVQPFSAPDNCLHCFHHLHLQPSWLDVPDAPLLLQHHFYLPLSKKQGETVFFNEAR